MRIVKRALRSEVSRQAITLDARGPSRVVLPHDSVAWRVGWAFEANLSIGPRGIQLARVVGLSIAAGL